MGTSNYDTKGSGNVYIVDDGSYECPEDPNCDGCAECENGRQDPIDIDWFIDIVKEELGEKGDYDYNVADGSTSIAQLDVSDAIPVESEEKDEYDDYMFSHYTTIVYRHGYYDGINADLETAVHLEGNGEHWELSDNSEVPEEIVANLDVEIWEAYKKECEASIEKARAVIVKYTTPLTVLGHMSNGAAVYEIS